MLIAILTALDTMEIESGAGSKVNQIRYLPKLGLIRSHTRSSHHWY